MPKVIVTVFAAIALSVVAAGPVAAQAPLDPTGQLAGYIPPTAGAMFCSRHMNKSVTMTAVRCGLQCAINFASAVSKGLSFDNDFCDNTWFFSCQEQYNRALEKVDQGTCLNCLDAPARVGLYPTYRDAVNTAKDQIYCDNNPSNTPFYDGHGFVSQQREVVKCQNAVMRVLQKAAKCLNMHCHVKTAQAMFRGKPIRITNGQCEDQDAVRSCKAHYDVSVSKLVGCPPCVDMNAVWTSFQQALDLNNGDLFCSDS
jgi:hypothetical protein